MTGGYVRCHTHRCFHPRLSSTERHDGGHECRAHERHYQAVEECIAARVARQQCAREMRRVLKPGGRVLAVDFGAPTGDRQTLVERFHRHGRVDVGEIVRLLAEAGFEIVESGAIGMRNLNFVLATAG